MNSATDEVLAQFLFLTGLGCFPLAIALALVGMVCKSPEISLPCFSLAAVAFTHFLWYFKTDQGKSAAKQGPTRDRAA